MKKHIRIWEHRRVAVTFPNADELFSHIPGHTTQKLYGVTYHVVPFDDEYIHTEWYPGAHLGTVDPDQWFRFATWLQDNGVTWDLTPS